MSSLVALQLRLALFALLSPHIGALAVPPRRVILFDVMDTIVADPFFGGMHSDVFGCQSLEELYAVKDPDAYLDFERGIIDESTLCERYFSAAEQERRASAGLDRSPKVDDVRAYLRANYRFIDVPADGTKRENSFGMETLLRELRAFCDADLHAFSNYGPWWRIIEDELRLSRFLEWSFVSCESGLRKPDPAAYTQALTSLGLAADPSRVVFVDDSRTNCEAAAALGIDAVQFTDVASLRAALVERGFTELIV